MTEETIGSFDYFRRRNHQIYQEPNERIYSNTLELVAKIVFYAARLREKGIHKRRNDEVRRCSVMAFSWLMAFANRIGMTDINIQLYRHFCFCPYCTRKPCVCEKGPKPRRTLFLYQNQSGLMERFQTHVSEIYPQNTIERSGNHLVAESAELMEAWMTHRRYETTETMTHLIEEFCDVAAHLVAIAHCGEFSLERDTVNMFRNGCPGCNQERCVCDYTEIVGSIVHR